jgi:NodT family efflux transporter outer membrane factor (OMF) lipoprotein
LITELELARTRGALANAQSTVPFLENSSLAVMHRMSVLLGEDPMSLVQELGVKGDLPPIPEDLPAGLPSDLLSRRPDIRKAEREVAAATARIGVSKAELFPRFSLTGSFGAQSGALNDLTDEGNRFWYVGPSIHWNILNLKRIFSNIEVTEAVRDESLARYEKSLLLALEEVENALATLSWEKRRAQVLVEGVKANGLAVDLALSRHKAGLESYLAVLDARTAFLISQDQLALSRQSACLGLVALYKALGGGWPQVEGGEDEGVSQSEGNTARRSAPQGG